LLASVLSADVLVLKDGSKISGRVVEKGLHFEVTTPVGLRTFLREDVDEVLTSPKELLGDTDKLFEEAKQQYTEALALQDPSDRNGKLKDALEKVRGVRGTLASTRELFTEDKYADLDQKLMQVMQLMRLLRERVTVDLAKKSELINPPRPSATSTASVAQAITTLVDPVQRADGGKRAAAREAFIAQRAGSPEIYDLMTAAMIFLGRSDADWRLQGGALKAIQEYFAKPWFRDAVKLSPSDHLEAAGWLATQVATLRKADGAAPVEAISLFGAGHLGHAASGPQMEKATRALGMTVQNGLAGTPEGHVISDLDGWIAAGDFDLAALAWVKEFREIDTPAVRFVWAWSLIRLAQAKKKGFDRSISALGTIQASTTAFKEHLGALSKSVKASALCATCVGEGKLRCTNCHGVKEIRTPCAKCGGKGKVLPQGLVVSPKAMRKMDKLYSSCTQCKGTGFEKVLKCDKCKDGFLICKQCDGKEKPAPEMSDICASVPCADCEGRGCVFRNVHWACPSCLGIGQKLVPKSDPAKVLP
jgi:hypothetical protein